MADKNSKLVGSDQPYSCRKLRGVGSGFLRGVRSLAEHVEHGTMIRSFVAACGSFENNPSGRVPLAIMHATLGTGSLGPV